MKRTTVVAAVAVAATALALTGCADSGDADGPSLLTVARAADVTTLDADAVASSREGWETLGLIADSLFGIEADGTVVPSIATGYEFNEDATELTVTLREGVVFSDGSPVTSADVAFTIENAKTGELQGALFAPIVQIDTPDESTVVLHYESASSGAVTDLASYAVAIIPEGFGGVGADEFWRDPVTVGPFTIDSWQQGVGITLVRNESYFGQQPQIDGIEFRTVPDENTRLLQLQNGTVDLIDAVSTAQVGQIEAAEGLHVVEFASGQNIFFTLNSTTAPFDSVEARRAVSLAIDRQSVVDAALRGYGSPGGSFIVPSAAGGFSPPFGSRFDPEAARAELAAAGLGDGFAFEIMYGAGDSVVETAMQVIQQQLAEVGITATLAGLEGDAVAAKVDANDWHAYVANIITDTDAGGVLQYYGATNGFYAGDADMMAAIEAYYQQANAEFGGQEARNAIFAEALDAIAESALQVALYDPARLWGAGPAVSGVVPLNPTGAIDFTAIRLS